MSVADNFMSGLQTGANLLTTGYNIFSNERARKDQLNVNKKSEEMSNTQISRSLKDAHNAGLSTAQWLSINGMVSNPSLGSIPSQSVGSPDVQSPSLRYKEMERQETLAELQQESIKADIRKTEAETESIKNQTSYESEDRAQNVRLLAEKVSQLVKENEKMDYDVSQRYMEESIKSFTRTKLGYEADNLKAEAKLKPFVAAYMYGTDEDIYFPLTSDHQYEDENGNTRHSYTDTSLKIPAGWRGMTKVTDELQLEKLIASNDLTVAQTEQLTSALTDGTFRNIGDLLLKLLEIIVK